MSQLTGFQQLPLTLKAQLGAAQPEELGQLDHLRRPDRGLETKLAQELMAQAAFANQALDLLPLSADELPPLTHHAHPVQAYLNGLAPSSRRPQLSALDWIARRSTQLYTAETMPWQRLRRAHMLKIRGLLEEHYQPATANRMLAALRGVLRECWQAQLMTIEEYQAATNIPAARGEPEPRGRHLSAGELRALFQACSPSLGDGGRQERDKPWEAERDGSGEGLWCAQRGRAGPPRCPAHLLFQVLLQIRTQVLKDDLAGVFRPLVPPPHIRWTGVGGVTSHSLSRSPALVPRLHAHVSWPGARRVASRTLSRPPR